MKNDSRAKPVVRNKSLRQRGFEKNPEESDFLPTLSNYEKSKLNFLEGFSIFVSLWSLAVKVSKAPKIKESNFFISNASREALIYGFLAWLSTLGLLAPFAKDILVVTLYIALGVSCLTFIAKIIVEAVKAVVEMISSLRDSATKKTRKPRAKKDRDFE